MLVCHSMVQPCTSGIWPRNVRAMADPLRTTDSGARALPDARTGDPSDTGMQQLSLANKRRGRLPCEVLTTLYLQMPQYKLLW